MSAPETVPRERIREVVTKWKGNLKAAAAELGLDRNYLRRRCKQLRIDLDALRHPSIEGQHTTPKFSLPPKVLTPGERCPPPRLVRTMAGGETNSVGAVYASARWKPRLIGMQTAARDEQPIKTTRKPLAPTRLLPDQQEVLREAKFDLQARFRTDLDESAILQQFFDEEFPGWKVRKLAADDKGGDGGGESGSDVS